MSLPQVIAGNEPPIDNTPIFGSVLDTMASVFSADASQYAAFRSFYAAVSGGGGPFPPPPPPPPPPPVLAGVLSVNTADGVVVMDGANGVAVSSGTTPTVSLGDITPASLTASGTITAAGALTGGAATFGNIAAGSVSCADVATGVITTPAITGATITASGAVSAASAVVTGQTTVGSFAIPGAISLGSFLNGSLETSVPAGMDYGTPSGFLTTICGWTIQWGVSTYSDYFGGGSTIIPISWTAFNNANGNTPAVGIFSVRNDGGGPCIVNATGPPIFNGMNLIVSQNAAADPDVLNATVGWIAIGRSAGY